MRSNLLSLQKIAEQNSVTQNRIATGLKVSSATQNPSSYYTAVSLKNKANDLNILIDSITQSIQNLKNIDNTIDAGMRYLEQAQATAQSALGDLRQAGSTAPPKPEEPSKPEEPTNPDSILADKNVLLKLMRDNGIKGTVVSTTAELVAASKNASSGDTIVMLGTLSYKDSNINLDNVKLTGAQGLLRQIGANDTHHIAASDNAKLIFNVTGSGNNMAITTKNNSTVSDIEIEYNIEASNKGKAYAVITNTGTLVMENIKVTLNSDDLSKIYNDIVYNTGTVNLKGNIDIIGKDSRSRIMHNSYFGKFIQDVNSTLNFDVVGDLMTIFDGGTTELYGTTNIVANANNPSFINSGNDNIIGGTINVKSDASSINMFSKSKITLTSKAYINIATKNDITFFSSSLNMNFKWEAGAKVTENNMTFAATTTSSVVLLQDTFYVRDLASITGWRASNGVLFNQNISEAKAAKNHDDKLLNYLEKETQSIVSGKKNISLDAASNRFNNMLGFYDSLIKSNSYLGENLLRADNMTVRFGTQQASALEVNGFDISSQKLGLNISAWKSAEDIEKSLVEISNALVQLRQVQSVFNNYNNIIDERDSFLNVIVDVLNEGSDKLTLADMNEESANILSLESRQQLAINSLSLAAHSSRSVLTLFNA